MKHLLPSLLMTLAIATRMALAETPILNFDDAVARARTANPALAGARARVAEAEARVRSAGELPDPELAFGAQNVPVDRFALDQDEMTMLTVGVMQRLPPIGQRALRRESADHRRIAEAAQLEAETADVIKAVRRAWLEWFYLERAIESNARMRALAGDLEAAERARYAAQAASQSGAHGASARVARLVGEAAELEARRARQRSELARLMNEPLTDRRLPAELPVFPPLSDAEALRHALFVHPSVRAAEARISAAQTEADATRREHGPNYALEAEYGYRQAEAVGGGRVPDMLTARVTLSLPIFPERRQDARDAEQAARVDLARASRDAIVNGLRAELDAHLAELRATEARLAALDGTELPRLEQASAAARADYAAGRASLAAVIEHDMAYEEAALRRWRIAVDRLLARTVIEHHTNATEVAP